MNSRPANEPHTKVHVYSSKSCWGFSPLLTIIIITSPLKDAFFTHLTFLCVSIFMCVYICYPQTQDQDPGDSFTNSSQPSLQTQQSRQPTQITITLALHFFIRTQSTKQYSTKAQEISYFSSISDSERLYNSLRFTQAHKSNSSPFPTAHKVFGVRGDYCCSVQIREKTHIKKQVNKV